MDKKVVKELNAYLKGEYMAIKSYDDYLQRMKNPEMREELQRIQQDHIRHAASVSERISDLGGRPATGPGMMGTMAGIKNLVRRNSDDTNSILADAGVGEYRGIRMAEEVVRGDLDAESLSLVRDILEVDRRHVSRLGELIH